VSDYGRERLVVVELDMPYCQLEYGTTNAFGTCNASLTDSVGSPVVPATGTRKCFNTRSSCQDSASYLPATQVIRFAQPQRALIQYDNVFPCIAPGDDNPATTPGAINLGGMDRSLSALGAREAVDIQLEDFRWNDHLFDKYRLERISGAAQAPTGSPPVSETYDPYERGTFWGKFLARNPYYAAYRARVLRGFMGDALADMATRSYIVDRITGPSNGKVQIALKDLFSLIEARKAVAPLASQGELDAGITSGQTTATLSPAGIGASEYPASGYLAIGDEIVSFTRSADALTIVRAQLGTVAAAHDAEDLVQLVLAYDNELAHDIIYDLLTTYAEILPAEIPKAIWDINAASMPELYTTRITEPLPVKELIAELCEQAGCTVWADPATGLIEFRALRATAASVTVNDRDWIVDQSLSTKRQDTKRVSQTIVYYGQIRPNEKLDEPKNFRSRAITQDADAESATQYAVPARKEIFSRWLAQFARTQALGIGARVNSLFRNPPLEATFRIYASREGRLLLAEPFLLDTFEVQDDTGAQEPTTMMPVEIARGDNEIEITAQGVEFYTDPNAPAAGTRTIYLDSTDMRNLNLRTVHDSLYAAPTGSEVIEFILPSGFTIGSTSTSSPALTTGTWPTMATTIKLTDDGRIQGKAGNGGTDFTDPVRIGTPGGLALQIDSDILLSGSGEIFGGGGGGGSGGNGGGPRGGGGGGGAGTDVGIGGDGQAGVGAPSQPGQSGTADAGGAGGAGSFLAGNRYGGNGGNGGGPGLAGATGDSGSNFGTPVPGGAGGAAGAAINGISLATIDGGATLDIRGAQTG
jgi:hypothetical protein